MATEEKRDGGGNIKVFAADSKLVGQRYLAEGGLEDLGIAEKSLQKLLWEVSLILVRMRSAAPNSAYKPSKVKVSAEGGLVILTCTMACDLTSGINAVRLKEALPNSYTVTVR